VCEVLEVLQMTGPLAGLRVLDCSQGLAGPRATGLLADYGADVVWVERPGGDPTRRLAPGAAASFNRAKRSIEADLKDERRLADVLELADRADVFVESWRPGVAERLGLGYEALHARNPRLIYVSISGFGEEGPHKDVPGYESVVQALLGGMADQVAHREAPVYIGFPFASIGASHLAVIGALSCLLRRDEDGAGRRVATSLVDGALAYNSMMWGETDESVAAAAGGQSALPMGATSVTRLLTRSFECADGTYLGIHTGAVGAFGRAMKVLGIDDRVPPSETGMDIGVPLTPEQIPILADEVPAIFKTRPRSEWVRLLMEADVCAIEHLEPTECYDSPQARHNEMVVVVDDPVLGPVEQVAPPAKLAATPATASGPAPQAGQHTDEVLATHAGWPAPPEAAPAPSPDTRPLLDGVRILDLGAYYAGPYSSRLLADLGAEVIKVEPVLGDQLRGIERPFYSAQAGKRAIAANLKDPGLQQAVKGLLAWADIVHHNLRPGAAERLGLDFDSVKSQQPDIIYLHAPGWGSTGPYAMRQSFAPMLSGYVGVTFEIAGRHNPPLPPTANEDPGNGLVGAVGMLMALLHRRRSGEGQYVENPQLNATMTHLSHIVRLADGSTIGAGLLDPLQTGLGPFDRLYQTEDGWVLVAAFNDADQHAALGALKVDHFADPDLQGDALVSAFFDRSTKQALSDLSAVGVVAVEPVGRNVHNFMTDPEQRRIGRVAELPHPVKGNVRELHVLLRVSDADQPPHRLAPELGQDTDQILSELGYTPERIEELRTARAIR
jgi:crotonobetainyl-CoA:carnitine CoA-transferase CaiB-like acyl-CoA transferase